MAKPTEQTRKTYFRDSRFTVSEDTFTNSRVSFSISQIGSARRGKRRPTRIIEIALALLGPIVCFASPVTPSVSLIGAILCWIAAGTVWWFRRDYYVIVLYTQNGEETVAVGNRARSIAIMNAINAAIVDCQPRNDIVRSADFDRTVPDGEPTMMGWEGSANGRTEPTLD